MIIWLWYERIKGKERESWRKFLCMNAQIAFVPRMNNSSFWKTSFISTIKNLMHFLLHPNRFLSWEKSIAAWANQWLHFNNNPILFSPRRPPILIAKLIKISDLVCFASFGIYESMRKLHSSRRTFFNCSKTKLSRQFAQ